MASTKAQPHTPQGLVPDTVQDGIVRYMYRQRSAVHCPAVLLSYFYCYNYNFIHSCPALESVGVV
jgi:hypothetical protein